MSKDMNEVELVVVVIFLYLFVMGFKYNIYV